MEKIFNITSGKMVCSDPCYVINTFGQAIVNVRNGKWVADTWKTNDSHERVSHFWVYNLDAVINDPNIKKDIESFKGYDLPYAFGIDSGQFGFFDHDNYRNDEIAVDLDKSDFGDGYDKKEGDTWYRACCKITTIDEDWGVIPFGAVSGSGGDGSSYKVKGIKDNNDLWVAICIEFIPDDGHDYEEDDEDEETED